LLKITCDKPRRLRFKKGAM